MFTQQAAEATDILTESALESWATGGYEYFHEIPGPPSSLPSSLKQGGGLLPPLPPVSIGSDLPDDLPIKLPLVRKAADRILKSGVVSPAEFHAMADAERRHAFTITTDLANESVARIRDALSEHIREGDSFPELKKRVDEMLGNGNHLSQAHLESVMRTNVATAYSDGQDHAIEHPAISDAFPYRAYYATRDTRTRENHLKLMTMGLDGTNIYRADDPVWQMFRPPWDYSCRCGWAPISVRQAARRGVKEAQEWLARAKELAELYGTTPEEQMHAAAPRERAHVARPDFEPSPRWMRR